MYPVLFHLGSLAIHSYGVMLMVGFLAGLALTRRQAARSSLSPEVVLDLGVWVLLASVVLARGLFLLLDWSRHPVGWLEAVSVWREPGLSFFGGLAGGILAALVYAHLARLSFWRLADAFAPGIALGYAITRIGCFLNGCCYGVPTHRPWGVVFPGITTEPVHPTQLYASAGSLLLMALLLWLQPRLKAPGQLFVVYLMLYSMLRGIVEIFRRGQTAEQLFQNLPITQAQFACGLLLLAGAVMFVYLGRRGKKADAGEAG